MNQALTFLKKLHLIEQKCYSLQDNELSFHMSTDEKKLMIVVGQRDIGKEYTGRHLSVINDMADNLTPFCQSVFPNSKSTIIHEHSKGQVRFVVDYE